MNKKLVGLLAAGLLAAPVSVFAGSKFELRPYVGADAQWRYQTYQKDFGGNIFKKSMPQGNLFVGATFNDYVGVELGYAATDKVNRDVRLVKGQFEAGGDPITVFQDTHTTGKVHGPNINVVGFLPVACENNLQLVGSIGVASFKVKLTSIPVRDAINPAFAETEKRTFSQHKTVARIGGGMQYLMTESIGARAMINWENTGKFKNISAKESTFPSVKMKDAWIYSLGVFYKF